MNSISLKKLEMYLPAVFGMAVILLAIIAYNTVGVGSPPKGAAAQPTSGLSPEPSAKDEAQHYADRLTARFTWGVSAIALAASLLLTIACSIWVLLRWSTARGYAARRSVMAIVFAIVSAALLAAVCWALIVTGSALTDFMAAASGDEVPHFAAVTAFAMFALGCFTIFLLLGSACVAADPQTAESVDQLRDRVADMEWLFFTSSLLLIAAVFEIYALFQWPAASPHVPNPAAMRQIGKTVTSAVGAIYTALVLAVFFPLGAILRRRAISKAIESGANYGAHAKWLEENGLSFTWQQRLVRVLTALGPLIAGTAVSAIAELFKAGSG
jgi:hypothetical protein